MPLSYDYAFGSSLGGEKYGSVCNNSAVDPSQLSSYSYLLNGQLIPDAISQVSNYTSNPTTKANIAKTLHVFWTGNNDVIASLGWVGRFTLCVNDQLCVPGQQRKHIFIYKGNKETLLMTCPFHRIHQRSQQLHDLSTPQPRQSRSQIHPRSRRLPTPPISMDKHLDHIKPILRQQLRQCNQPSQH